MTTMTATTTFEIAPTGAFSLAQSNAFEFGHRDGAEGAAMQLAFALDGSYEPVGVELHQEAADGPVRGQIRGGAPADAVRRQVARVLSLDHDGVAWQAVLDREPPLKAYAERVPGMRPVLFHSPYEAAAWSVISARINRRQGIAIRDRIAAALGSTFELAGTTMHAFPSPEALLEGLDSVQLPEVKRSRLAGIAQAAADGRLDVDLLQAAGPEAAIEQMLELPGIGPFYAMLIVLRGSGFADALGEEPRARAGALAAYGLPERTSTAEFRELAERWRPFRTWATVLCRVASTRS